MKKPQINLQPTNPPPAPKTPLQFQKLIPRGAMMQSTPLCTYANLSLSKTV